MLPSSVATDSLTLVFSVVVIDRLLSASIVSSARLREDEDAEDDRL